MEVRGCAARTQGESAGKHRAKRLTRPSPPWFPFGNGENVLLSTFVIFVLRAPLRANAPCPLAPYNVDPKRWAGAHTVNPLPPAPTPPHPTQPHLPPAHAHLYRSRSRP